MTPPHWVFRKQRFLLENHRFSKIEGVTIYLLLFKKENKTRNKKSFFDLIDLVDKKNSLRSTKNKFGIKLCHGNV